MQVSSESRVASPVSNEIDVLVEELMLTAREIIANPAVAVDCRDKYGLLAVLGADASRGNRGLLSDISHMAPVLTRHFPFCRLPIHGNIQGTCSHIYTLAWTGTTVRTDRLIGEKIRVPMTISRPEDVIEPADP